MKGKKIFKKIVVSVLTLAIMCSNIPVTAGSMPEEEITAVTEEASEPETSDEMPEAEETTGPEQSGLLRRRAETFWETAQMRPLP